VRNELWYEKAACKVLLKLTVIPKFFAQFFARQAVCAIKQSIFLDVYGLFQVLLGKYLALI
jgi:hypothetical protein